MVNTVSFSENNINLSENYTTLDVITNINNKPKRVYLDNTENNNIISNIETVQDENTLYFNCKDLEKELGIKLHNIILNDKNYIIDNDYKFFFEINNEKNLFLTYEGLLRVLFTIQNYKNTKFIKWATHTLFTIQNVTDYQKNKLISSMKNVTYESIQELFNTNSNSYPVVYLKSVNTVEKLKDVMNINNNYSIDDIVYEFGLITSNGHKSEYKELEEYSDMKLVYYTYIDPLYISQAELELKNLLNDYKIKWNNHDELVIIPNNILKFTLLIKIIIR